MKRLIEISSDDVIIKCSEKYTGKNIDGTDVEGKAIDGKEYLFKHQPNEVYMYRKQYNEHGEIIGVQKLGLDVSDLKKIMKEIEKIESENYFVGCMDNDLPF